VRGNRFAAADSVNAFIGLGFERNLIDGNAESTGESFAHFREMRPQLRFFQNNYGIDILDDKILPAKQLSCVFQEEQAIRALSFRIRIRKQLADIAETSRSKQRVAQGVGENVAVRMSNRPFIERNLKPADD
jgi:hypothetical protein